MINRLKVQTGGWRLQGCAESESHVLCLLNCAINCCMQPRWLSCCPPFESQMLHTHSLLWPLRCPAAAASVVVPIGLLAMGAARHRALLFKVLADELGMPCRVLKGRRLPGALRHLQCMGSSRQLATAAAWVGTVPLGSLGTGILRATACMSQQPCTPRLQSCHARGCKLPVKRGALTDCALLHRPCRQRERQCACGGDLRRP